MPARDFCRLQDAQEAQWQKLADQALDLDKEGKYDQALPLAVEALKEAQASLGPDDPLLAVALGSLARVYRDQGEYAKAEALDLRAVALVEKVLGPQAPELAPFLINLANVYSAETQLAKAEPLLLRVLRMDEKTMKPDSPDLAGDLNNLATVYYQQGKYDKAEPLFERALKIDTKAAGDGKRGRSPTTWRIWGSCSTTRRSLPMRNRYSSALWRSMKRLRAPNIRTWGWT